MIHRIKVEKWISDLRFELRHPSGTRKAVTTYLPLMEFENSVWAAKKCDELGLPGTPDLIKIALCAGPHSRLWIGDLDGIIAPMDVLPKGWTYPSSEPVESSWFWQWTPSPTAEKILMQELEDVQPLSAQPKHLKSLAPFQLRRKHGAIAQVNAIDLIRLPDIFSPKVDFIFEVENGNLASG